MVSHIINAKKATPIYAYTDKLKIQVLPFETDDENERYKVIMECINNFMGNLNISISGIGRKMYKLLVQSICDEIERFQFLIESNELTQIDKKRYYMAHSCTNNRN